MLTPKVTQISPVTAHPPAKPRSADRVRAGPSGCAACRGCGSAAEDDAQSSGLVDAPPCCATIFTVPVTKRAVALEPARAVRVEAEAHGGGLAGRDRELRRGDLRLAADPAADRHRHRACRREARARDARPRQPHLAVAGRPHGHAHARAELRREVGGRRRSDDRRRRCCRRWWRWWWRRRRRWRRRRAAAAEVGRWQRDSIVNARDTAGPPLPAASTARTSNMCEPSPSAAVVYGDAHGAKLRAHPRGRRRGARLARRRR